MDTARKSSLSPGKKRLLEMMQEINFGKLEGLCVRNGEPTFDPPPCVEREIKFASEQGSRPERDREDFALNAQVIDLFKNLALLGNGTVKSLQVKNGLPFLMSYEETIRE